MRIRILHSFLYSNTAHICIYIKEMKDIGDTLQTRPLYLPAQICGPQVSTTLFCKYMEILHLSLGWFGYITVKADVWLFNNPLHPPKTDMKMEKITMCSLNQRYSTSSNCCFSSQSSLCSGVYQMGSVPEDFFSGIWIIWTLKNRNNQKLLIYADVATTSHLFLYTPAGLPTSKGWIYTYDILHKECIKYIFRIQVICIIIVCIYFKRYHQQNPDAFADFWRIWLHTWWSNPPDFFRHSSGFDRLRLERT